MPKTRRKHRFAGAAVYEQLKARGVDVRSVRVAGRALPDPDAALAELQKERASIAEQLLKQTHRSHARLEAYLDALQKAGADLPPRPPSEGDAMRDLALLESYAVKIQPSLADFEGKLPKAPRSIRFLAKAAEQVPPEHQATTAGGFASMLRSRVLQLASLDTETVEDTVPVEVTAADGKKLAFDIPVFDRDWSLVLQTLSMITAGVPAWIPLVPFIETGAQATHGLLAALATLPALAGGESALARSLLRTSVKKLGLAVPSLIPVFSTVMNTVAAGYDGQRAGQSRRRPTVDLIADLSRYTSSSKSDA